MSEAAASAAPPVLVTGANGALMAAIAASFARTHPLLLHVHERTDRLGALAAAHPLLRADLATEAGTRALAAAVRRHAPALAGLVLGASAFEKTPLGALEPGAVRRLLALDLAAPLELVSALHDALADGGRIVLLTDAGARAGWPSYAAYVAARAGLEGAVRSLARALGPRLTVFALAPGLVAGGAPFPARLASERTALGRAAAPAEIATALARAWTLPPTVLQGAILTVDGGLSLTAASGGS